VPALRGLLQASPRAHRVRLDFFEGLFADFFAGVFAAGLCFGPVFFGRWGAFVDFFARGLCRALSWAFFGSDFRVSRGTLFGAFCAFCPGLFAEPLEAVLFRSRVLEALPAPFSFGLGLAFIPFEVPLFTFCPFFPLVLFFVLICSSTTRDGRPGSVTSSSNSGCGERGVWSSAKYRDIGSK
jgi:hypothetical protein